MRAAKQQPQLKVANLFLAFLDFMLRLFCDCAYAAIVLPTAGGAAAGEAAATALLRLRLMDA